MFGKLYVVDIENGTHFRTQIAQTCSTGLFLTLLRYIKEILSFLKSKQIPKTAAERDRKQFPSNHSVTVKIEIQDSLLHSVRRRCYRYI